MFCIGTYNSVKLCHFILSLFHVLILPPMESVYWLHSMPLPLCLYEFSTLQWTLFTDRALAVDTDLHLVQSYCTVICTWDSQPCQCRPGLVLSRQKILKADHTWQSYKESTAVLYRRNTGYHAEETMMSFG